jgi:putative Mg2+ transporter-C (MgtC) family protein
MVSNYEILFRLVLAAILGAIVGFEREVHGRPAGVRTYLILSLGTALLMVLSEFLFFKYQGRQMGVILQGDPGRIAAQAITGVGFLGAGVIIRYKDSIRGLTTAACVWLVCSVGLAIGAGFYLIGSAVIFMTVASLVGFKALEKRISKDWFEELIVVSIILPGQIKRIQDIIASHGFEIISSGLRKDLEKKELVATFQLKVRAVQPPRLILEEVLDMEGIKSVNLA